MQVHFSCKLLFLNIIIKRSNIEVVNFWVVATVFPYDGKVLANKIFPYSGLNVKAAGYLNKRM
jgi:hypothetical protein